MWGADLLENELKEGDAVLHTKQACAEWDTFDELLETLGELTQEELGELDPSVLPTWGRGRGWDDLSQSWSVLLSWDTSSREVWRTVWLRVSGEGECYLAAEQPDQGHPRPAVQLRHVPPD